MKPGNLELAKRHLQDAKCSVKSRRPGGAYYLSGLAVECALKACIAKNTRKYDSPPAPKFVQRIYTHDPQS
ncbi:MAG: DNA-binding protein, partial [Nitrososphaera sp.]